MMVRQTGDQSQLFYLFNLEERIPANHLLRRINPIVTRVLADLREKLAPFYSRPKSAEAMLQLARRYSKLAITTLKEIAENPKAPYASRVTAAIALLDREWGKPASLDLSPQPQPGQTNVVVEFVRARDGRPADDLLPLTPPKFFRLPAPNPSNVGRLPPAKVAS
jgi:hypothetical protein